MQCPFYCFMGCLFADCFWDIVFFTNFVHIERIYI